MGFTVELVGDWRERAASGRRVSSLMKVRIRSFLIREAEEMRRLVGHAFVSQGAPGKWPKLSPWTIAGRRLNRFGGTKALIWSGEMRKSISTSWDEGSQSAFCGIMYQKKGMNGQSMVNIAKIHEYGSKRFAIRITPRMRKYLAVLARYLPRGARMTKRDRKRHIVTGIIVIKIPPRPFMRNQLPVFRLNAERRARAWFAGFMLGV